MQVEETLWFRNKVESLEQMMTVSLMFNVDDSPDSEVKLSNCVWDGLELCVGWLENYRIVWRMA